ncbi:hypothetical protein DRN67_00995 [Candidatus Micrarchaeota archaeon]|nr:MAG: hypothetical protein DRN67_00995 [Candidatus Micrarchaeota archaeon]
MIALALVALVLAGCTYPAPPTAPDTAVDFSTLWHDMWLPVAGTAIIIAAFFVSIAYMLGSALNNQMIIQWSKSELFQLFASALIVGGLFWLVSMIVAFSASLTGATGISCVGVPDVADKYASEDIAAAPCHIRVAQIYLEIMYENMFEMTRDLLVTGSLVSAISNFSITFEMLIPPWTSATFVPFSSLNMIFETLYFCFNTLTKMMILLKFQIYFLSYVWRALFPMLLVLGVILRTFWFTRRLGGLLIAIAIGIYVAMPLLYVLSYYILGGTSAGTYVVKIDPSAYGDITSEHEQLFESGGAYGTPYTLVEHPELQDMGDVAHRINSIENRNYVGDILSVAGSAAVAGSPVPIPGVPTENNWVVGDDGVLENTAKLLIYATFVPFMVLMTTISFIKGLSPLLGGDIEIAGITHLI